MGAWKLVVLGDCGVSALFAKIWHTGEGEDEEYVCCKFGW
jgi:hypothetical protein